MGVEKRIKVVLESNAPAYTKDMQGASKATADLGASHKGATAGAENTGRAMGGLKSLASEAASTFLGFASAQGVMQGVSTAVSFAKDTILGFDDAMTQSTSIMGDLSAAQKEALGDTARETAKRYGEDVTDVAKGFYFLASAGYDAETSQKAIGQVTAFAKAGMFDLEKATELAADAQNAMGLKSQDSGENLMQLKRITDVLTQANIQANGSVEQFGDALTNKAAAAARLAGVSLEDTVGVLEAFAAQGLKGAKSGEAFSIVLRDLQEKSRKNGDQFKALGVTVYDAQGKFAGFPTIIGQLEGALKGMSVEQVDATLATLGFTAQGGDAIKTLLGLSTEIKRYSDANREAAGVTQSLADKQMASLAERLKQLQALARDLALSGFDALKQALKWLGAEFGPAFADGRKVLGEILELTAPVAKGLAMLAGAAVVGPLMVLADTLGAVTHFLAENQTAAVALAGAGLGLLASQAAVTAAALAELAYVEVGARLLYAQDAVMKLAGAMQTMNVEAFTAGLSRIGGALTSLPTLAAGVGAALFVMMQDFQNTDVAAAKMVETLTGKIDTTSLESMQVAMLKLQMKSADLQGQLDTYPGMWQKLGSAMADMGVPFFDVTNSAGDLSAELAATKEAMAKLDGPTQAAAQGMIDMANQFNNGANATRQSGEAIYVTLQRIAQANNIDVSRPVEEWTAKLRDAYNTSVNATPAFAQLQGAFQSVADGASTAEDRVKAYKQGLDALIGVHVSSQQAENQFAGSLDQIRATLGPGINLLDAYSEANRNAREKVLAGTQSALDHAVSIYQETGSLQGATAVLGVHRDQLIATAMQTGMSRQAAEAYINTLGLTPENLLTTAHLNKDQAQAALDAMQHQLDHASQGANATVTADTSQATSALADLGNRIRDLVGQGAALGPLGDVRAAISGLFGRADGGIAMHAYAAGGLREDHVAQISRGLRVWAEPETGGEAYIPLGLSKRSASLELTSEVADMFGYQLVPRGQVVQRFATGGVSVGALSGSGSSAPAPLIGNMSIDVRVNADATVARHEVLAAVDDGVKAWTRSMHTELRARGRG